MSRIDDLIVEYCPDGVEFHSRGCGRFLGDSHAAIPWL